MRITNLSDTPSFHPQFDTIRYLVYKEIEKQLKSQHISSDVEVTVYNWILSKPETFFIYRMKK